MKRFSLLLSLVAAMSVLGVAFAGAAGVPEIDRANAEIRLEPSKFTRVDCAGEDGINYSTFRGRWIGGEVEVTPGSTDYDLSGTLHVDRIEWTVNLTTQRGVLTGIATLVSTAGAKNYSGRLTLITQGLPSPEVNTQARGWLVASTLINGVADGGSLLANIEVSIDNTFNAAGEFGDVPANLGFADYSVATINQTC